MPHFPMPMIMGGTSPCPSPCRLKSLSFFATPLEDAALVHLRGLTHLVNLDLGDTKIRDAGLARLQTLTDLQHLTLTKTQITDEGLE